MAPRLTIYPTDHTYQAIAQLAETTRRSLSQTTLILLEEALAERGTATSDEPTAASTAPEPPTQPTGKPPRSTSAPASETQPAGIPHLPGPQETGQAPAAPPTTKACPHAYKHHNHHRGNPCPKCGFPNT